MPLVLVALRSKMCLTSQRHRETSSSTAPFWGPLLPLYDSLNSRKHIYRVWSHPIFLIISNMQSCKVCPWKGRKVGTRERWSLKNRNPGENVTASAKFPRKDSTRCHLFDFAAHLQQCLQLESILLQFPNIRMHFALNQTALPRPRKLLFLFLLVTI